jgi:TPP-dependent 2-oxoacid decarboxylase
MKTTTVIDYIVQRIADEGIEHCFGVPGDYAFPVGDAVDRNPIAAQVSKHENGADVFLSRVTVAF